MGFLDKAKTAAGQAAAKAKEGVEEVQLKRELHQAQEELGRVAFELLESGAIQHERLQPIAERIRGINVRLEADDEQPEAAAAETAATAESSKSPADAE